MASVKTFYAMVAERFATEIKINFFLIKIDYAGMSNEKHTLNLCRLKLKVFRVQSYCAELFGL
jgi:hypothetical protein